MGRELKPGDVIPPDHIIHARGDTISVTMRTLIARINRKLKPDDQTLKISRSRRARFDLGEYYVLNFMRNFIVDKHVDPEELGRALDVLKDFERVVPIE